MERRYIDANALQVRLERKKAGIANQRYTEGWNDCMMRVKSMVSTMPTIDAVPIVHGRWKLLRKGDWTSVFVCSVCGRREKIAESESYNSQLKMLREYPYCHCGARMDGGVE